MYYTYFTHQGQPESQKVGRLCSVFILGIVRESGGNAVQLAYSMQFLFDVKPNETIFCASDIGWVPSLDPLISGRRTYIYSLCTALEWFHNNPIRGKTSRHTQRGRLLAGHKRV
jgi:hypothetical protein